MSFDPNIDSNRSNLSISNFNSNDSIEESKSPGPVLRDPNRIPRLLAQVLSKNKEIENWMKSIPASKDSGVLSLPKEIKRLIFQVNDLYQNGNSPLEQAHRKSRSAQTPVTTARKASLISSRNLQPQSPVVSRSSRSLTSSPSITPPLSKVEEDDDAAILREMEDLIEQDTRQGVENSSPSRDSIATTISPSISSTSSYTSSPGPSSRASSPSKSPYVSSSLASLAHYDEDALAEANSQQTIASMTEKNPDIVPQKLVTYEIDQPVVDIERLTLHEAVIEDLPVLPHLQEELVDGTNP